jgi:methionyl-tRNA formyltransferase
LRVLFAGTPALALPSLDALLRSQHEVIGVLTRPAAPAGRGRRPRPAPVAARAGEVGLPVLAPRRLGDPQVLAQLRGLRPDVVAVVAYGALVPPAALAVPAHGWVNLHFSLLPAWRGAAPVQHALLAGDEVTGATTFRLEEGLDTGPVYGQLTEPIGPRDTAGDLLARLSSAGAQLLVATLDAIEAGQARPVPQPADGVSYAPKLTVADAQVVWERPAFAVDRLVRAMTPDPGAWTTWRGQRLGLAPVELLPAGSLPAGQHLAPGELVVGRAEVLAGTGTDPVRLTVVHPAGRRPMPAADWARGVRPGAGERLGGWVRPGVDETGTPPTVTTAEGLD